MQPTVADRNNNPGNLKDTRTGKFRQFANADEGYAALLNDVQAKIKGHTSTGLSGESTLHDFSQKWAPSSDNNDPAQYTVNLANKLGVRPDTKLSELEPRIGEFAQAIASNEGYTPAKDFKAVKEQIQAKEQGLINQTNNVVNDLGKGNFKEAGGGVFDIAKKGLNAISQPFVGLAAIPTQALAKSLGQSDPFQKPIFGGEGDPGIKVSPLDVESKLGDAAGAASIAGSVAAGGGILKSLSVGKALTTPTVKQALTNYLDKGETIKKLSAIQKAEAITNAMPAASAGEKILLEQALKEIEPLVLKEGGVGPGLLRKLVSGFAGKAVGGGMNLLGLKEMYDIGKNIFGNK